ncbi:hypothetical protein Cs7R123_07490 [Catellatospora sp. TT07R-123]|uniref:hypothetical protein n=1 Tax=Catellatospora sp. TT07R-123 TaxID=2733863 RepID=UPI001B0F751B|nr:hypothetical protein [Catellatospora sp. TT07R-123]GHJ43407.1 hypothetical protein Cs7R123_07490 [Catellatospora sp. TT07R-123]
MTTAAARPAPRHGSVLRLTRLYLASRRIPAAVAGIVISAIALRIALHWTWTAYGARQLPLVFETACATMIAVTTASPFGEPERAVGPRLPLLRLVTVVGLTAAAAGVLATAAIGTHLAGGTLELTRNLIGLTGIGLLCAGLLGGALAWTGPVAYLVVSVYALYTRWHGPTLSSPWIWPAQPSDDRLATLCASLVLVAGVAVVAIRGARATLNVHDS